MSCVQLRRRTPHGNLLCQLHTDSCTCDPSRRGHTFLPGSWPPSPGFAPCATLISSWSAFTRNSGVTPKRPLATCTHSTSAPLCFAAAAYCGAHPTADNHAATLLGSGRGAQHDYVHASVSCSIQQNDRQRRDNTQTRGRSACLLDLAGGCVAGLQAEQVRQLDAPPCRRILDHLHQSCSPCEGIQSITMVPANDAMQHCQP